MIMKEFLTHINQYGFATDVFDKYRDAVKRSNRDAVRVLSCIAIIACIATTIFGFVTKQAKLGLFFCMLMLAAGVAGAIVSFRKDSSRKALLTVGYILSVTIHILAIYGTVALKTDAFWIGTQIAVGCYLFDYAWHVGILQLLSYGGLYLAWSTSPDVNVTGSRLLFSALFLLVSLVTFYTLNRTRTSLIMGKEESRVASETDLLTGLTIRMAAQQEIEEHLKTDDHGVLMLLDLDRFKSVNDRLGHQMGDKVLVDVAADLKKMFRNSDVLSRLGGDEFVVYLKSVPEKDWALQRASQVVREVRRWVGNGTTNIQVTASVGIVMTDMVARNYDDLYRAADIAMYTAKHEGGNKALFYTQDMLDNRETAEGPVRIEAPGRDGNMESAAR
jgi:diguanylate cyclase (GGDEF)-like protein